MSVWIYVDANLTTKPATTSGAGGETVKFIGEHIMEITVLACCLIRVLPVGEIKK